MIDLGADAATARAIQKSAAAAHASQSQALPQLVRRLDLRGYLMYRSGLVPRRMAVLGLIGGPLIIASGTAVPSTDLSSASSSIMRPSRAYMYASSPTARSASALPSEPVAASASCQHDAQDSSAFE